jgi:hypothetical protein
MPHSVAADMAHLPAGRLPNHRRLQVVVALGLASCGAYLFRRKLLTGYASNLLTRMN